VFNVKAGDVAPVPDSVAPKRATLAANAETALNALWDAGASAGDSIVVVGAGVVGLMVASIAARLPAADVTVVDIDAARRPIVEALGARFATPDAARDVSGGADIVLHTSASQSGLDTAIALAGFEGTIVELSWYGERAVNVHLGGAFHSQRLRLVSSQVGQVSLSRRKRWNYSRRLQAALRLLETPALDMLVAEEIRFEDAPQALGAILGTAAKGLAPVIRY
jgi:threonine dehydrogenase-like Zn-dependent dehydrogenase